MEGTKILNIENLAISFQVNSQKAIPVVNNVSFSIYKGETVGIVGESGCGKSLTCASILGILPDNARSTTSKFTFLNFQGAEAINRLRGEKINMVFQNALSALNPCMTIEHHFLEYLSTHTKLTKSQMRLKTEEILKKVGISEAAARMKAYPHEMSGGMCQRVMIALAIISKPELLIADEPTTALDVSIQSQIIFLLKELQTEFKMSLIFVSHNLSLISQICDRIIVMYAGEIVEMGHTMSIIENPKHPYTKGLIDSLPEKQETHTLGKLPTISGIVPDLKNRPNGCIFHNRCKYVQERCKNEHPIETFKNGESVRCFYPLESI